MSGVGIADALLTGVFHLKRINQPPDMTIEFPFPLPSTNEVLALHHWERVKFKKQIMADAALVLKLLKNAGKIKPITDYPIVMDYIVYVKNMRRDADNLFGKWVTDELVRAGIIQRDSLLYVACVASWGRKTLKEEKTVLEIRKVLS